jgi:4-hydroxy-tetrahydrodipicolinate synthase
VKAEEAKEKMKGVDVIVLTPFTSDYELDLDRLKENIRFLIKSGIVNGNGFLTVTGACGEAPYLTVDEQKQVVKAATEAAGDKVPIFVGVYQCGTKIAIDFLRFASEVGAVGAQISPPYYMTPSEAEVYNHYKAINDSVDIGIEIYNTPWSSKLDMKPKLISRLAELKNVIGIKWSSFDYRNYVNVIRLFSKKLNIIDNQLDFIWAHMLGAKGFVSIIGNFAPQIELNLWRLLEKGDYEKAKEQMLKLHIPLYVFIQELYEQGASGEGNPWKDAMELCGRPCGPVRPPQVPLNESQRARLQEILRQGGVIPK